MFLRSVDICGSVQSQNVDFRFNEIKSKCVLSSFSHVQLCAYGLCGLPGSSVHWDSLGKNDGESCHAIIQGPSPPRDRARVSYVSCMAGSCLTTRAAWKVHHPHPHHPLKKAARKKNWIPRFLFLMNIPNFLKVRK